MNKVSKATIWLTSLVFIIAFFYYQPWQGGILEGADRSGYYAYLPSSLIHQDIKDLSISNPIRMSYNSKGTAPLKKLDNGNYLNKYTCGVALLNLPAFGIAHLITKVTDHKSDGYSPPYNFMIVLSGLLYVIAGLFFLRNFLLNYFEDKAVALALIGVALGTNLYFTAVLQSAMAHAYLFFLVSVFLYLTNKWATTKQLKLLFILAPILGLIVLMRPTVIVVGLLPILLAPKAVLQLFKKPHYLIALAICFFIPIIPQLLYWKMITGNYISYSYGSQGFDFLNPNIINGLTSFKNGWLIYSPLMIMSLIGLIMGTIQKHKVAIASLVIFLIHTYVIYSWWCWNYINGFGSRAMVDIYPILAFPLTLFLSYAISQSILKKLLFILLPFFIGLNIFQTNQMFTKVLWSEGATKAYYLSIFGKTSLNHNALVALDCNILQPKGLRFKELIELQNFDSPTITNADSTLSISGKYSFCLKPGFEYSTSIHAYIKEPEKYSGDWFRVSANCINRNYTSIWDNSNLVLSIERDKKSILWKSTRINNKLRDKYYTVHNGEVNKWKEIAFFIPIDEVNLKPTDKISVYGWNTTKIEVCIDDLKLEIWGK